MTRTFPFFAALLLAGCGGASGVSVTDAEVVANPSSAAVYATIVNRGTSGDRLVGIVAEGGPAIGLHTTSNDGGVMRMREVEALDVPAGGTLTLESGGAHGMAMAPVTASGERVVLTFRFEKAGAVRVAAERGAPGAMEHGS